MIRTVQWSRGCFAVVAAERLTVSKAAAYRVAELRVDDWLRAVTLNGVQQQRQWQHLLAGWKFG